MIDIRTFVKKRIKDVKGVTKDKKKALKRAPDGRIVVRKRKNSIVCCQVTEHTNRNGKYLRADQKDLIKALVQKEYDQNILENSEEELRLLTALDDFYKSHSLEDLYMKYAETRRQFIVPIVKTDDQVRAAWDAMTYEPLVVEQGSAIYKTKKGEIVRSKSELMIANMLYDSGIPYHYELPLDVGGKERRPDFSCLNVRERRVKHWEHLGMMDASSYAEKQVTKLNQYMSNGFILGINLIITLETRNQPLTPEIVQKVIKAYLL